MPRFAEARPYLCHDQKQDDTSVAIVWVSNCLVSATGVFDGASMYDGYSSVDILYTPPMEKSTIFT
jgi:hypothetical protein